MPLATIYRLFGSKRGILSAFLDVAFVADEPLAHHDRPDARAAAAETDPRRLLARYARLARGVLERSGPLQQMLRSAAAATPNAPACSKPPDASASPGNHASPAHSPSPMSWTSSTP